MLERSPAKIGDNQVTLRIDGPAKAIAVLHQEAGGHRIQRVPPTEKRGRVQTSTVTVAVLEPGQQQQLTDIPDRDLKVEWFSGSGAGGQHRNKHQNSCRLIHLPTGIRKESQCRSRRNSFESAKKALIETLNNRQMQSHQQSANATRADQVGSGMRGDKIRTYRFQEDQVINHLNNQRSSCKKVMAGRLDDLQS